MCHKDVLRGSPVVLIAFAGPSWTYCANVHAVCLQELMPSTAYNRLRQMVVKSGWMQLEMPLEQA